jgi:hypothetical protein
MLTSLRLRWYPRNPSLFPSSSLNGPRCRAHESPWRIGARLHKSNATRVYDALNNAPFGALTRRHGHPRTPRTARHTMVGKETTMSTAAGLIVSVSGIRGVISRSLTPADALAFASAHTLTPA